MEEVRMEAKELIEELKKHRNQIKDEVLDGVIKILSEYDKLKEYEWMYKDLCE